MVIEDRRQSKKPHFFKPFLPDSYEQLKIPTAFLKHLARENCQDGEEIILKNPRCKGKSWSVKLEGFCFKEGWTDFARDHGLCLGEFVVFRHEGGLVFNVMIFDHSTCEKKNYPAIHINIEDDTIFKKEIIAVDAVPLSGRVICRSMSRANQRKVAINSSSRQASFEDSGKQFKVTRPHRRNPSIPRCFLRFNDITKKILKVIIKDQKGRSWPVNLSCRQRLGNGWCEFVAANCLKEEDTCVFKLSQYVKSSKRGAIVLDFTVPRSKNRGVLVREDDKVDLTNSTFKKNLRSNNRGVIVKMDHKVDLTNSTFERNLRSNNRGVLVIEDHKVDLANSTFKKNLRSNNRGVLVKEDDKVDIRSNDRGVLVKKDHKVDLVNSTFKKNLRSNTRGVLVKEDHKFDLTNSTFKKNLSKFNLRNHCLYVPQSFSRLNGLVRKKCQTTLTDGQGRSWRMELRHRKSDGQVYILSDWAQISASNGLKVGDTCTFGITHKRKQKIMKFSLL